MNKIFDSENIDFVEISEVLVDDYLTMVNDIENVEIFIGGWHEPYTKEDELKWIRGKLEEKAIVFSLIDKKTKEYIGNTEFMNSTDVDGELGIALTAKKQNKGFGTEAVKAMIDYGFNTLGYKRIYLRTNVTNLRAQHVYKKCGFKEYDRKDNHICMEIKLL